MTIKVGIIEDENQIRQSLSMIIDGSEGFSCRHIYENAEDAILAIPNSDLDIVLTDLHLPGKTGIECIKELKPICPSVNFLIFTSFEDTDNIFNALKVGAIGYLVKTIQPSKLLDAIVEAYKGGAPMSSQIARKVVQSFNGIHENIELEKLSNREREILDLLSKGLRYKEIADKLFLSTETVRTHIRNTYEKLQVNSRTEALNKIYKN
jgi:DNA-binding NarL/FixJ family response regulator